MYKHFLLIISILYFTFNGFADEWVTESFNVNNFAIFDPSDPSKMTTYEGGILKLDMWDYFDNGHYYNLTLRAFPYKGSKSVFCNGPSTENIKFLHVENPNEQVSGFPMKNAYIFTANRYALQVFHLCDKIDNSPLAIVVQLFINHKIRYSASIEYDIATWNRLKGFLLKFKSTF